MLGGVMAISNPVQMANTTSMVSFWSVRMGAFINKDVGITPNIVEIPQKSGRYFGFFLKSLLPTKPPMSELTSAIPPTIVIISVAVGLKYPFSTTK